MFYAKDYCRFFPQSSKLDTMNDLHTIRKYKQKNSEKKSHYWFMRQIKNLIINLNAEWNVWMVT